MIVSFLKYDLQSIDSIYISGTPDIYFWNPEVCCYKLLDIIISQDRTLNRHVGYILKKANSHLCFEKTGLAQHDLLKIYCSLVRSRIEYVIT
jgi:hypothetical protein